MPAISGVPGHADGLPGAADPWPRWRRVFPGDQPQLGVLRRWLSSLLPDCAARDDVLCVATELATNAVLHTATGQGGWFAVEITWYGPVIRVAVADCGGTGEPQLIRDPGGEHGRGLALVQGLAVRSGFLGDRHGRLVWADVPWDRASAGEDRLAAAPRQAGWPAASTCRAEAVFLGA
jgi:hypothetical protein